MYAVIIGALLSIVLVTPVHSQVHVDIGIHLPAPPPLIVVPEMPRVQYVPAEPANLFFYNGQYWAFMGEVLSLLDNETGMHSCLESKPRSPGDTGGKRRHPRAYENTGIGADEPEA